MTLYYEPLPNSARAIVSALGSARGATSLHELGEMVRVDRSEQLVVIGSGVHLADALAFASRLRLANSTVGVLLLRENVDIEMLGEAIRAGVREVVEADDPEAIRNAAARSLDVSRNMTGQDGTVNRGELHGRIVTVFAGKGGCGKSTISTNLAVALCDGGRRRVLLVDLDLSFGDVAIMLQLVPERSFIDAIPMAGRLDETGLRSLITPYAPGLDTLLAPVGPADGERISRELVTEALRLAVGVYDYIVVDTPPFFSDQVLAALDMSAYYVLLATPDIQALKNLRLTLDMFDLLEYPREQRVLVLNRADARVGLTPADIERVVRAPILGHIPSTRDVPVSINQGVPLVVENPMHPVSKSIRDIAEAHLAATPAPTAPVPSSTDSGPGRRRRSFSLRRGR